MKPVERLVAEFRCAKCRGTSALAHEIYLPRKSNRIPVMVAGQEGFVFVSCALCGYTETYNLKVLESKDEKVVAPDHEAASIVNQSR